MEIFSICGRVAALGYTYFRILRVCLSISLASVLVRVLHPCVALALWKLLRGCSCCVLIWWTHLTDGMLFVCLCTSLLWSGSLVLPFPAAAWMKVECISQAICSRTCVWKVEREKHLRITQCGMSIHIWWTHLTDGMLFVCLCTSLLWSGSLVLPFPTAAWMKVECISEAICYLRMEVRAWKASQDYSMWNDHSQNSSWKQSLLCLALELNFWWSFRYRSGCRSGRPRNRTSRYQRETFSCCVGLAPYDYRLARNDSHLQFCCEGRHSTQGINQEHLRAEGFCYLSMARSTKKTYLGGRFPSIAPCTDLISISWVEGFGYHSIRRVNEKYIYTYRQCLWSVTAQGPIKIGKAGTWTAADSFRTAS